MATATKNGTAPADDLPEFDPSFASDVDQSTIEESQERGPSFPIIQWHYGDPKMAKVGGMDHQGGWFFPVRSDNSNIDESEEQKAKKEAIGAAMEAAGWTATTWIHDSGGSTEGYWKREIAISTIALRKCWEFYDGGKRNVFPWNEYEKAKALGRPSSRLHVLCLVKGLEEVGPLTLTLKGSGAMAFEGTGKVAGALQAFGRTILKAANDASAKAGSENRWAARCFWLPVGADRTADGKPKFTAVGTGNDTSNIVVPIALGLPESSEGVELRRFYVGKPLQDATQTIYTDNEEWRTAWETMEGNDNAPAAHTNGTGPKTAAAEVKANEDALSSLGL